MRPPIRLLPEARAEFDQAADWYEDRRPGLGGTFVAGVRAALDRIAADPARHAVIYRDIRKSPVPKFPYIILYREEPGAILVVSVFHTSRNPSIWKARI